VDGVEHVSNLIVRHTIIEAMYEDILKRNSVVALHQQFEVSLVKLYASILCYLGNARQYYDKSTASEYHYCKKDLRLSRNSYFQKSAWEVP